MFSDTISLVAACGICEILLGEKSGESYYYSKPLSFSTVSLVIDAEIA